MREILSYVINEPLRLKYIQLQKKTSAAAATPISPPRPPPPLLLLFLFNRHIFSRNYSRLGWVHIGFTKNLSGLLVQDILQARSSSCHPTTMSRHWRHGW